MDRFRRALRRRGSAGPEASAGSAPLSSEPIPYQLIDDIDVRTCNPSHRVESIVVQLTLLFVNFICVSHMQAHASRCIAITICACHVWDAIHLFV